RLSGASILLISFLSAGCGAPAPSSEAPTVKPVPERVLCLVPNSSVTADLQGGESHRYRLELPQGHFADLTVEQQGVDVALQLVGPNGRAFPKVDTTNGTQGPEPLPLLGTADPLRLE